MAYLAVVVLSLLVGAAVYSASLQAGRERPATVGFDDPDVGDPGSADAPGPGYTYLRVATRGPSWPERIQGLVGLMILLIVATAVLAFGVYQMGHLINVTVERFLEK